MLLTWNEQPGSTGMEELMGTMSKWCHFHSFHPAACPDPTWSNAFHVSTWRSLRQYSDNHFHCHLAYCGEASTTAIFPCSVYNSVLCITLWPSSDSFPLLLFHLWGHALYALIAFSHRLWSLKVDGPRFQPNLFYSNYETLTMVFITFKLTYLINIYNLCCIQYKCQNKHS